MANVIHRTTLQYLTSANSPDYPEPTWKHSPDMTQVAGVPRRHQKWDAGTERPVEMTQPEKDAVDAAADVSAKDAAIEQLNRTNDLLRAVGLVLFDVVNDVRNRHGQGAITLAQFRAQVRARMD